MAADKTPSKIPGLLCSARLNLALVMFFGCAVVYALRANISFALVCMVHTAAAAESITLNATTAATTTPNKCESDSRFLAFFKDASSTLEKHPVGEFDWSKRIQGAILSAFFFGYMTSQVLGGYFAQRIGAKRVVGVAIFACSILTIFNPLAARWSVSLLIVMRAVLGFFQGVIFPAMHSMWALWSPPLERGLLTGLSYAGSQVGNVLTMPVSGVLCRHGIDGGWPSIFYALGALGAVWCVAWALFVADTPQTHRRISSDERRYIIKTLSPTTAGKRIHDDEDEDDLKPEQLAKAKLPLRAIFASPAVWACFIGHFAGDWGAYTMATGLPLYMNDALGLDPTAMGILSALPYVAYFIMINLGGFFADQIQARGLLNTLNTRRLAMILALGGQALFLILIAHVECGHEHWLILLLMASLGISGLQYSGFIVNYLDICPAFAGTVIGIGQTISCLGGIISPLAIGFLTPTSSREEWQHVFYLTALVLVVGALLFCVLASGSVQEWADPRKLSRQQHDNDAESSEKEARKEAGYFQTNLENALNKPLLLHENATKNKA